MTTIFVDADACPVKPEILKVAERCSLPVVMVANTGLRPSRDPMVKMVTVSGAFDAADDWIVDNAVSGDIAITADVPLASRLVEKGVHVTGPTGKLFTPENIGVQSGMRNFNQHLREAGEIKGYNTPFSARDRSNFLQAMDKLVRLAQQQEKQS